MAIYLWPPILRPAPWSQCQSPRPWLKSCNRHSCPEREESRWNTAPGLSTTLPARRGQYSRLCCGRKLREVGVRPLGHCYTGDMPGGSTWCQWRFPQLSERLCYKYVLAHWCRNLPPAADQRCTVAFAGLWYLTLCLSAKLRIAAPHYALSSCGGGDGGVERHAQSSVVETTEELDALLPLTDALEQRQAQRAGVRVPIFLLILPCISLGLAIFIAGTRYFDFCNHGFDVFAGAAAGTLTASFAFQLYGTGVAAP